MPVHQDYLMLPNALWAGEFPSDVSFARHRLDAGSEFWIPAFAGKTVVTKGVLFVSIFGLIISRRTHVFCRVIRGSADTIRTGRFAGRFVV